MFWIHSNTKAETIKRELETFGEIIGDIKFMVFRNRDNMSEEARMLAANNVERGDTRVFRMKRKRDIPRYAWIDGTKVKIMYEGQPATCIRCHEPVIGGCLGGGVRKKCRELVPEILRDSEQWERKKNIETVAIDEEGKLGGDVLEFYNVPADMTNVVLADWIRLRSGSIIDPNTLSYTPVAKVRLLNKGGLEEDEVFNIVKTCNRVKIEGGAFIRVNAVQLLTPVKKPKPEEECLEGEDEDGVDRGKEDGSRDAARRNLHGALNDPQVSGNIPNKQSNLNNGDNQGENQGEPGEKHENVDNKKVDEATKIVVSAETTNSGTTKGNGSGHECDAQNTINHPDELGHFCQKLDQIIGEVDKMGQEVDQVTGDTLLLSTEEGREMMNQKLDKAEEELNSLGQELGDIIEEDDDDEDEDSLHSALGFPDRSKSGSVKSLIDEFELRSMAIGTSPSWAEMMDREEEEKIAKIEQDFNAETPKSKRKVQRKRNSIVAEMSSPEDASSSSGASPDLFKTVRRVKSKIKKQRTLLSMYANMQQKLQSADNVNP